MRFGSARAVAGILAAVLVVGACGGDTEQEVRVSPTAGVSPTASVADTGSASPTSSVSPTASPSPTVEVSPTAGASQTAGATPTTNASPTTDASDGPAVLPGTPFDLGPPRGAELAVVGRDHDDPLAVHQGPGTGAVVATLGSLDTGVVATGAARLLPGEIWFEVQVGPVTGWVHSPYLAYAGSTDDITWRVVEIAGETPTSESMADLGRFVAELFASGEPSARISVSAPPTVGDLGEVTVDVVGLGDDSIRGYRLGVFAHLPENGEGFTLKSVERTLLCSRGLHDGICV